ncbi:unnamed protein product [Schistocephalus solidus]|uniref:Tafazzin family protein n=1 Tax=Schistocephalus solidus TaxID=70667 RepID=A0A3P7CZH4_SCHSO|nr:unnamed protein product [Schistocephalus solidus]
MGHFSDILLMQAQSAIPIDLAFRIYRNARDRTLFQRVFHLTSLCLNAFIIKSALLRHNFKIINQNTLLDLVRDRPAFQPLITVSNHHCCLDDFLLTAGILPMSLILDVDKIRWTLAAVDICFINILYKTFFASGKGIPVWRRTRDLTTGHILNTGLGVDQPSIDFSLDLLNSGRWLHMFPQGRVVLPEEREREAEFRLRWGIGRLIAESKDPIILPVWHCNFDSLNPPTPPYFVNTVSRILGTPQCLTVTVGQPFQLGWLKNKLQRSLTGRTDSRQQLHAGLTAAVQNALYKLKIFAEAEHEKHKAHIKQR